MAGEGDFHPLASPWCGRLCRTDPMMSFNWGHHSPGSDDAFPTPFVMELIVVIVLFPFLTLAFVVFFAAAFDFAGVFACTIRLSFDSPMAIATSASPLTTTSRFPSALINRGAMPPTKLITRPSTTTAFAKLVKPLFYRRIWFCPAIRVGKPLTLQENLLAMSLRQFSTGRE